MDDRISKIYIYKRNKLKVGSIYTDGVTSLIYLLSPSAEDDKKYVKKLCGAR